MVITEIKCKNCGGVIDIDRPCEHCGSRFIIESPFGMKPVKDVIGDVFYHHIEAIKHGTNADSVDYFQTGRLTGHNLAIGIGALATRLYKSGGMLTNTFHLIVPPILYVQTNVLMCSELFPGAVGNDINVLPRFISCVWIDGAIPYTYPNIPWFLSVVQPKEISMLDEMYYGLGYTP